MLPVSLLLMAWPATADGLTLEQTLGKAICRLRLEKTELRLSDALRVTLSVEGGAPVDVNVPAKLTGSADWRARPAGPPRTVALEGGRERWEQTFLVEPFRDGDRVPLPLLPIRFRTDDAVRDRELTWEPVTVRVTTTVRQTDLGEVRPMTGIEKLPPVELTGRLRLSALLGIGIGIVAAALVAQRRKRRRLAPPRSATELVRAELAALKPVPDDVPRLADLVRRFLERRFPLPATTRTTAELLAQLAGQPIDLDRLRQLLTRCDLVKFANDRPPPDACGQLLAAARALIESIVPDDSIR